MPDIPEQPLVLHPPQGRRVEVGNDQLLERKGLAEEAFEHGAGRALEGQAPRPRCVVDLRVVAGKILEHPGNSATIGPHNDGGVGLTIVRVVPFCAVSRILCEYCLRF